MYNDFIDRDGKKVQLPLGIAHFLEHKIFEDEERDIFSDFAKLGANVNAYTNFASTVYYYSTVDRFSEALKILIQFVLTPHLTEENVEKEKGIIIQEIKMYDDDPNWRVYFNGLSALYHEHPISKDIAGTVESVSGTQVEDLMKAYRTFYTPENMVLFMIGDFNPEEIADEVLEYLPKDFTENKGIGQLLLEREPADVKEEAVSMTMGVPIPLFNFFIKCSPGAFDETSFKKSIVNRIALDHVFGKASAFYNDNYGAGFINDSFGYEYSYGEGYAYMSFGGESTEPEVMKEKILSEIENFCITGISEESFNRIKRKIIGRHISSFNSIQYTANTFINYYLKGIGIFDFMKIIEAITLEDVNATLNIQTENRMTLSKVM
jgi:predicted Zn-dependent peptidase